MSDILAVYKPFHIKNIRFLPDKSLVMITGAIVSLVKKEKATIIQGISNIILATRLFINIVDDSTGTVECLIFVNNDNLTELVNLNFSYLLE